MRRFVKGPLKTLGLYNPALHAFAFLQDPPTTVVNFIVRNFLKKAEPSTRGRYSKLLIDRYVYNNLTPAICSTVESATRVFNELSPTRGEETKRPTALILMLRGPWFGHALQNYLVGCALRLLGYRVGFVVCHGAVERCGISQDAAELSAPPFTCNACRKITDRLSSQGFDVINLNDFITPDEDDLVETSRDLSERRLSRQEADRTQESIRPFLMRFFYGDYRRIKPSDKEVVNHLKSAVRFQLRFRNLLEQVRPSCLCFFNGLFFPENVLFSEAQNRQIPSLFVERGMRKNTIFISLNEPACHYRSDRLWACVKDQISDEQLESARAYLTKRMAGPEDPLGNKRDLADVDTTKYSRLAEEPYVILFAPVTHDTAAMGKDKPIGDFYEVLTLLCRMAIRLRKKLVIRSHPDELSDLSPSRYTVKQYLADNDLLHGEYVQCLDSNEKWDPYALAKFADAAAIYNGTLGIELPSLGYEVFNIANSNYTGKGFTVDVNSAEDFELFFTSRKRRLTHEQQQLALKYLYFYVYVASISIGHLLNEYAPFQYSLAETDEKSQREDLNLVKERIAFLLGISDPGEKFSGEQIKRLLVPELSIKLASASSSLHPH
jgi:hypothetical protein